MRKASSGLVVCLALAAIVAGCGSDDQPSPGSTTAEAPSPTEDESIKDNTLRVAALGDSITAGSPLYDPDPVIREQLGFGDDERSQFEYWASEQDPKLVFENCGVFGERVDEIAKRLDDCVEGGAETVIVQGGINDIAQALSGGSKAAEEAATTAAAGIDGIVARAQDMGLEVAVTDVLPWTNGHPIADDAIATLNDSIEQIAKRRDATLLRFHDELEDPDQPGVFGPGLTDDGDHPSIDGYKRLGDLVAKALR